MSTIASNNTAAAAAAAAATNTTTQTAAEEDSSSLIATTDQFLTLLLAQLKHQDPMEPMKGTEFIDSITRLSSVEQDINQNRNLESIAALLRGDEANFGTPVSYLDRTVEFSSAAINLDDGEGEFFYNLEESSDEVSIIIRDINGATVTSTSGTSTQGRNTFNWDGINDNGNLASEGLYFIEVTALKRGEDPLTVESFTSGRVEEVSFQGSEVVLSVGRIDTTIDQITRIRSEREQASNDNTDSSTEDDT